MEKVAGKRGKRTKKKMVFGNLRDVVVNEDYCFYCGLKWGKKHPKCSICGISIHLLEYPCPECDLCHTFSKDGKTCLECSLTEDNRIEIIQKHNNEIKNIIFTLDKDEYDDEKEVIHLPNFKEYDILE